MKKEVSMPLAAVAVVVVLGLLGVLGWRLFGAETDKSEGMTLQQKAAAIRKARESMPPPGQLAAPIKP